MRRNEDHEIQRRSVLMHTTHVHYIHIELVTYEHYIMIIMVELEGKDSRVCKQYNT